MNGDRYNPPFVDPATNAFYDEEGVYPRRIDALFAGIHWLSTCDLYEVPVLLEVWAYAPARDFERWTWRGTSLTTYATKAELAIRPPSFDRIAAVQKVLAAVEASEDREDGEKGVISVKFQEGEDE